MSVLSLLVNFGDLPIKSKGLPESMGTSQEILGTPQEVHGLFQVRKTFQEKIRKLFRKFRYFLEDFLRS